MCLTVLQKNLRQQKLANNTKIDIKILMFGQDQSGQVAERMEKMTHLEKLEKMVLNADYQGENIIICYDSDDGFWIGKRDRFEPDPRPLECGKKNGSLGAAIEAACRQMAVRKALRK